MGKIKKAKSLIIIVAAILIWNHMPYYYNNDKTVSYVTFHATFTLYVCLVCNQGNVERRLCPIGLVPAYTYDITLPQMGFEEIPSKGYKPKKGDISVLPQNEVSSFGHIAIYGGKQWVSDYEQKNFYPNPYYKKKGQEQ